VRVQLLLGDRLHQHRSLLRVGQRAVHTVNAAGRVWAYRARSEREASSRFDRLAVALEEGSAGAGLAALARQPARDEHRHARLCSELASRFRCASAGDQAVVCPPLASPGLGQRELLLYEVVAMCCVTETLSAALLVEMMRRADDREVKRVVHEILRDEIDHSRLGWAHLAVEHERGITGFLAERMPALLAATVTEELFWPGEGSEGSTLDGYGALGRRARLEIFLATMCDVVFPGLERFAIDTMPVRRWLAEQQQVVRAVPSEEGSASPN
jgi:hypothetical protein